MHSIELLLQVAKSPLEAAVINEVSHLPFESIDFVLEAIQNAFALVLTILQGYVSVVVHIFLLARAAQQSEVEAFRRTANVCEGFAVLPALHFN